MNELRQKLAMADINQREAVVSFERAQMEWKTQSIMADNANALSVAALQVFWFQITLSARSYSKHVLCAQQKLRIPIRNLVPPF